MTDTPTEIVIPREKAVFRLDRNGRWRNASGLFQNRRIIDYFNAAIHRDEGGYYVSQQRDQLVEKVYFPYEDTALFVVDVQIGEEITLVLNTQRRLPLETDRLWIETDGLYLSDAGERIKFSDRALLKLADRLDFEQDAYFIRAGGERHRIRETPSGRKIEFPRKEIGMYKVSVMYPNQKGSRFDLEYYRTTHMALVEKHMKPFGLLRTEVLRGISGGGGQPAPYVCIGNLYFDSADGYEKGGAASGGVLRADIPNFTDVTPTRQISEVLTIG